MNFNNDKQFDWGDSNTVYREDWKPKNKESDFYGNSTIFYKHHLTKEMIDGSKQKIIWSLLRKYNEIPHHVKSEYKFIIDAHMNKKKVKEETFFKQKPSDFKATFKGKELDMSYYKQNSSFSSVQKMNPLLISNLTKINFLSMTAIQQTTIPLAIEKNDVIGCSDTGSGKTLAFLLPIISQILDFNENFNLNLVNPKYFPDGVTCPYVLIMAPTRELAEQINAEARKIINDTGLHSVAIYGGVKIWEQSKKLEFGSEILVATPGRLIDMLKQKKVSLNFTKFVVLDEADEMLNMGFLPQIKDIFNCFDLCSKNERQNLMFSATFEEDVKALARDFLNEFYFVTNGGGGGNRFDLSNSNVGYEHFKLLNDTCSKWKVKENLKQIIVPAVNQEAKINYICNILIPVLERKNDTGAIVFVDKKSKVDEIKQIFNSRRIPTTCIHGDKGQQLRDQAIKEFKRGRFKIIVGTNILARGLDFVEVDYVFNFDLPMNIEDYIHRIGRTGRLGEIGHAITFIEKEDKHKKILKDLITYLRKCSIDVPEWLGSLFPELAALNVKPQDHNNNNSHPSSYGGYNNNSRGMINYSNNRNYLSRDNDTGDNRDNRDKRGQIDERRHRERSRERSRSRSRSRSRRDYSKDFRKSSSFKKNSRERDYSKKKEDW